MQVQVSGKHVAVGEALRERVTDEISSSIAKYFERGGFADVVVSKEGHSFRVDCSVHLDSGNIWKVMAWARTPMAPLTWPLARSRPGSAATSDA